MASDVFTVRGIDKVSAAVRRLAALYPLAAAQSLNEVAELTMTDAKDLTPYEHGVLKDTGKVSEQAVPAKLEAQLTFGTDYAVYVHEIPPSRARHPHGQWKFLETAVNKREATFSQDVGRGIRERIGG